jgi:hypothetical protein
MEKIGIPMIMNKKKVRFFISIFFKKKGYMKILKYIGNPVNTPLKRGFRNGKVA